ncbi:hypothetical protein ACFLS7_04915, partial [Bacteroidota bacterium]
GKKAMNTTEQSSQELPDDELVSLFYSLIWLRQLKEQEYYERPTPTLAGEVIELKKKILEVLDVILGKPLGDF